MSGYINLFLQKFYGKENSITSESIWSNHIEEARVRLQNLNKIRYVIGYPQGSEPTFYVFCETEELMEHTKDWLNCSLPRFCCQYARPCKKAEFEFEASLLEYAPHGFLKVLVWSQQRTGFDTEKYKEFIPYAVDECQTALDDMIERFNNSPNIRKESDKSIGMLIKDFMTAYQADEVKDLVTLYDEIEIREDIERRNKETLKFMRLEKEQEWDTIIHLAHERNVAAQVISSGVTVAIANALVFTSCKNWEALNTFEIDWPKLYECAQEFYPVFMKPPVFESESEWCLWATIAHAMNIEGIIELASGHIEKDWLDKLIEQDTHVSAEILILDDKLDLTQLNYDESSVARVLSYAQTCHESEVMDLYEWIEGAPLNIKMPMKSQPSFYRLWQQLEVNATNYFQRLN